MENQLRQILIETASAFAKADACAVSTVSKRVKNDPNFFTRLHDANKTFTARTFDEVMSWFASNWPTGNHMPLDLLRWIAETNWTASDKAEATP